ncbi:MAG TPA: SxtJ family membrane protein [Alphaproteobacteria bacterium]|nr:SxtJ family membrane protein [Alphaproteobacteria bacterium]
MSHHEDLRREEHVKGSSNRSFGLVFGAFFLVVGLGPMLSGRQPRIWSLGLAVLIVLVSLLTPRLLAPFNRLWLKAGLLLSKVVTPVAMGLLFVTTIVPMGLAMRLGGKDPLRRRFDPNAKTYWIQRMPPGPPPESMKNQF